MYITMEIEEKQFKRLLKLVYLGNFIVNGNREGVPGDEKIGEYDEISEMLLKLTCDNGYDELVRFNYDTEKYEPTDRLKFDGEMTEFIKEYDDLVLWDELGKLLAERDAAFTFGPRINRSTDLEEREKFKSDCKDKYFKEFAENGVRNLFVATLEDEFPAEPPETPAEG